MFILADLPLGINFIEILIHLFNFLVLVTFLSLLIYKPVKKFMAKREDEYKNADSKSKATEKEALSLKEIHESILNKAKQDAVHITEQAEKAVGNLKQEILNEARAQANEIIKAGEKEVLQEKEKAREELVYTVSELAIEIAQKILEREIREEDNDTIINNILDNWKD